MDVTELLKERARLIAIIEEAATAAQQVALYNRLIVVKAGNQVLSGVNGHPRDGHPVEPEIASESGYQVGVCPVPDCPGIKKSHAGTKPTINGMVRHIHFAHPDFPESLIDEVRKVYGPEHVSGGPKRTMRIEPAPITDIRQNGNRAKAGV